MDISHKWMNIIRVRQLLADAISDWIRARILERSPLFTVNLREEGTDYILGLSAVKIIPSFI